MNAPFEPWGYSIKTLLWVFGVLLIACVVAPWKVAGGTTVFSWTGFKGGTFDGIAPALTIGLGGIFAIALAATPMAVPTRGLLTGLLGFAGAQWLLLYAFFTSLGAGFAFRPSLYMLLGIVGMLTLIPGLLVRAEYRAASLPRILVTIGVICFLIPYLIPQNDSLPLVALFKSIGATPGRGKVVAILNVVHFVLLVATLIAWLPAPSSAMANILAWILILWPILVLAPPGGAGGGGGLVPLLILGSGIGAALKGGLDSFFYVPITAAAWAALAGYGFATVYGKKLER
jgi:hypothetical protein